jgi:hypothetical protein
MARKGRSREENILTLLLLLVGFAALLLALSVLFVMAVLAGTGAPPFDETPTPPPIRTATTVPRPTPSSMPTQVPAATRTPAPPATPTIANTAIPTPPRTATVVTPVRTPDVTPQSVVTPTPQPEAPRVSIVCFTSRAKAAADESAQKGELSAMAGEKITCEATIRGSYDKLEWNGPGGPGHEKTFLTYAPAQKTTVQLFVYWTKNPVQKHMDILIQLGQNCTQVLSSSLCVLSDPSGPSGPTGPSGGATD